jgi:uncharacterized membrane protein YedE/YeeE
MTTTAKQPNVRYLTLGFLCGVVLLKSEIATWFRIQEMLRFQGFNMFGFFFSSVLTAALSLHVLRARRGLRPPPKEWGSGARYALGGTLFGVGWGMLSACPGPIYALIGSGVSVLIATLVSVLVGTWLYGVLRPRLPH